LFKGRSSKGIRGIQLNGSDKVISLSILDNTKLDPKTIKGNKKILNGLNKFVLSVTENGYGKRSSYADYRVTNRGGKGIIGIINSPRNGSVSATLVVEENDEIILSTDKGSIMRCAVKEIRIAGRNTQGVRIKKLSGEEKVVSVIKIEDNIE
jgi:DNA gyrase subunit A